MLTYSEAQKVLEANKRRKCSDLVRWDAGDGFVGEGYYCSWRKRIVTCVVSPAGHKII